VATPVVRRSSTSASALVFACALVVLSMWKVDRGLTERRLTSFNGNDAASTSFRHFKALDQSRSELYSLLATAREESGVTEAWSEEVRRLTLLSLMVYATGDGNRRYVCVLKV
jgi:hypothetical protein